MQHSLHLHHKKNHLRFHFTLADEKHGVAKVAQGKLEFPGVKH